MVLLYKTLFKLYDDTKHDEYYFDIIQEKDRQLKRQRDEYEKRISELKQQVQNLQDKIAFKLSA